MMKRMIIVTMILVFGLGNLHGTPPYGDPNQPYDRLPGTLETYHMKWSKPMSGEKLNVLFISPYHSSREIVEAAQRLDMKYSWIMNATNRNWLKGWSEGNNATQLSLTEAKIVMDRIVKDRLNMGHYYNVIVIGKISWGAIPENVRKLILQHVRRGTGLVYVSPNQEKIKVGTFGLAGRERTEKTSLDKRFSSLFQVPAEKQVSQYIFSALPMDTLPLHVLNKPGDFKGIPGVGRNSWAQASICLTESKYGKGKIIGLDYFDGKNSRGAVNLTPWIPFKEDVSLLEDRLMYDYYFALLSRCILWTAGHENPIKLSLAFDSPPTNLKAPVNQAIKRASWTYKTPKNVIARKDCRKSNAVVTVNAEKQYKDALKIDYWIRNRQGDIVKKGEVAFKAIKGKDVVSRIKLPVLERGTYFFDVRILDYADYVLDFASKAFRIETKDTITKITTDKEYYNPGQSVKGEMVFSSPLPATQHAAVKAVDTWGRTVFRSDAQISTDRMSATFSIPVKKPLSRLWDIYGEICDKKGIVSSKRIWVGLPDWKFDDYIWMTIFCPQPGSGWKGNLYHRLARKYGINAVFTAIIYGLQNLYEFNERLHMQSISYADHFGEAEHHRKLAGEKIDPKKENSASCMAEISKMYQHMAKTGEFLDPKQFPYKFPQGTHVRGAEMINSKMKDLMVSAKFGSPLYVLTGEEYLMGERPGISNEFSGFAPLTTQRFQEWCKEEYKNDLNALNKEWNTQFKSWDQVRGILLQDAVEKNQLPRWVDFRYFMRSRIWSDTFVDITKAIKRFIPQARTGRCGHDHHDFTRYKKHMSVSKLYICPHMNIEWKKAILPEILQSFSNDNTFLLGSASHIRWQHNFQNKIANVRYPWKMLFMGLNGFDWEMLLAPGFGGCSSFTPDFSERLPFFKNISREVQLIQNGIGKLTIVAKPVRSKVAILWAPNNHYISRLLPFQDNGFSGGWMYNISIDSGAHSDVLAMFMSLRIRPTFIGPEDVENGDLKKRGFKALVLPYSKGMSEEEAKAIKEFVKKGGLVIADNQPATYSEHGRKLEKPRLQELFPSLKKMNVVSYGKGHAVYLPNKLNGYLGRVENGDYTGSDTVEEILKKYAGITPPVEMVDKAGVNRRDTFMPVFQLGATRLVGFMRMYTGKDKEPIETQITFDKKYHVWDVRNHEYLGYGKTFSIPLDLYPYFLALLPANPTVMSIKATPSVPQGRECIITGDVEFDGNDQVDDIAQTVNIRVYTPDGKECEFFRDNVLFKGRSFSYTIPISYSECPGRYSIVAENAITGIKARTSFDITGEGR